MTAALHPIEGPERVALFVVDRVNDSTQPDDPGTDGQRPAAERGVADLGRVGFDDAGRTVEMQVVLTRATLAIAAMSRPFGAGRRAATVVAV